MTAERDSLYPSRPRALVAHFVTLLRRLTGRCVNCGHNWHGDHACPLWFYGEWGYPCGCEGSV